MLDKKRPSEYTIKELHKINLNKLYIKLVKKDKNDKENK